MEINIWQRKQKNYGMNEHRKSWNQKRQFRLFPDIECFLITNQV